MDSNGNQKGLTSIENQISDNLVLWTISSERERRDKIWEWLLVYSLPLSSSSSPSYSSPTSLRAPEKSSPTSRTSKTRRPLPREMSHFPLSLSPFVIAHFSGRAFSPT
ncbi:unnamed protein product, partial [Brassica oleracea var. botrytis]